MPLTKEQEELYKKTMEEAKRQLENIDEEMEKEIQAAREILAKLQASKKNFKQLYEGAAKLLGIEVDLNEEEKQGEGQGESFGSDDE